MKLTHLLIGLACILPHISYAENIETTMVCEDTKTVLNVLKKYKETPFIFGSTGDQAKSLMSVWINPNTRSWTITATVKDITCIVGYGGDITLVPYDQKKSF